MAILDTEKIINGTDSKRLKNSYEELKTEYTDDAVQNYRKCFIGKPLSFIVKNAKYISAEPQYGLPFMSWTAKNVPMRYDSLCNLRDSVKGYYSDAQDKMNPFLKDLYGNAISDMDSLVDSRSPEGTIEVSSLSDAVDDKFFDETYARLCKSRIDSGDEEACKIFGEDKPYAGECDNYQDFISKYPSMAKVTYLTPYAKELDLEKEMCESYLDIINSNTGNNIEDKTNNLLACEKVQTLAFSDRFMEGVNSFSNANLRSVAHGILNADIGSEMISAFNEAADDTINPVYYDQKSAVNSIMEESVYDDLYREDREKLHSDLIGFKHAMYECVRNNVHEQYVLRDTDEILMETPLFTTIKESMGITGPVTVEEGELIINEAVAEVEASLEENHFFEYTATGAPNKVLAKRHVMYGEVPNKNKAQNQNNNNTTSNDDDDEDDDDEDNSDNNDNQNISNSNKVSSNGMPSASNPNSKKPVKAKPGLIGKVQNAGMEAHKVSRAGAQKVRQLGTGIKNAGKAVLKIPSGLVEGFKSIIHGFDEMDDNRRKEYMLKPGYRKKVLKNIRVACTYGLGFYVSKLSFPIIWLARRLSKEKDKRIRNEFASELETEIKICEEKIQDAAGNMDKREKYQLMRLKDQYARERERVLINSKAI